MRTVHDLLQSKAVFYNDVAPTMLVLEALSHMESLNLSYLVVLDGGEYKGVFSERDYSRKVILQGRHSNTTTVGEVMTTDLPVVSVEDNIEHCMILLAQNKTRYLPVFDEERFLGIVTIHDILRLVIASKEEVFDRKLAGRLVDDDESGRVY